MNPMQLLTASKSLMDIKDATGRYRMAEGNLFPKFNSTARAGSPPSTAKAEAVKPVAASSFGNQFSAGSERNSKKAFIRSVLIRTRENILKSGRTMFAACAKACSSVTGTLKKIKLLSYWKGRQPTAKAEKFKSIKPAVQGELSLDKVKVIRNDLSDTDLEIVPVTNLEQSKMPEPAPVLVTESEPTKTSWGRLASRIFGPGQTSI